jgi:hypothetical protein
MGLKLGGKEIEYLAKAINRYYLNANLQDLGGLDICKANSVLNDVIDGSAEPMQLAMLFFPPGKYKLFVVNGIATLGVRNKEGTSYQMSLSVGEAQKVLGMGNPANPLVGHGEYFKIPPHYRVTINFDQFGAAPTLTLSTIVEGKAAVHEAKFKLEYVDYGENESFFRLINSDEGVTDSPYGTARKFFANPYAFGKAPNPESDPTPTPTSDPVPHPNDSDSRRSGSAIIIPKGEREVSNPFQTPSVDA